MEDNAKRMLGSPDAADRSSRLDQAAARTSAASPST
jgi:hypothetical protein